MCLFLGACSFSNSSNEVATTKPSDELEFAVDTIEPNPGADIKVEEQKIAEQKMPDEISPVEKPADPEVQKAEVKPEEMRIVASEEGKEQPMVAPEEPKFQDYQKAPEVAPVVVAEAPHEPTLGAEAKYHVQKGETLMMVAFKIYGDYRKWKDLKAWNPHMKIGTGSVIKYYVPDQTFGWQPSGLPYLVKTGDTLGIISMDKYGTSKKWKSIYENNRPLIRDPNLIFAGFTIYYMPVRDVASEHK